MSSPGKNYHSDGDSLAGAGSRPNSPELDRPSLPATLPSRNLTPRGLRFDNLDDALRNITGRSASSTTSRKPSSTIDSSISEDIPLQLLGTFHSTGVKSDTMLQGCKASPPAHLSGRSLTHTLTAHEEKCSNVNGSRLGLSSPDCSLLTSGSDNARTESLVPSDATGNTVDRIYAQYQFGSPEIPNSPFNSKTDRTAARQNISSPNERNPAEQIVSDNQPDITDQALQQPETEPNTRGQVKADTPNLGPETPTPPEKPRRELLFALTGRYTPNPPASPPGRRDIPPWFRPELFKTDGQAQGEDGFKEKSPEQNTSAFPVPLRVQSIRARGCGTDRASGQAHSNGEFTSDSDDDPFKYDKQSYTVFLKPSKEREVSAALCRVSGISRHSQGTLCSPDGSPLKASSPPPLPCLDTALLRLNKSPTRHSHFTKNEQTDFFEASALSSPLRRRSNPNVVKITLNKPSAPPIENPHALNEKNLGLSGFQTPQEFRQVSEVDEWETVVTDGREPGGQKMALPSGSLPSRGPFKPTGSSIADVSDTASWSQEPADEYGSTDRILQHPTNDGDAPRFKLRHLKGSQIPIFVAKQRVHRVNGMAQDSGRLFTGSSVQTSMHTSTSNGLSGKLTDSLQNLHTRNKQRLASFRNQRPQVDVEQGREKSVQNHAAQQPLTPIAQPSPYSEDSTAYEMDRSNFRHSSLSTISDQSHGFAFNLISLPEAARLQAVRRASGQEDQSHIDLRRDLGTPTHFSKSVHFDGQRSDQDYLPRLPHSVHYQQRLDPILSSRASQDLNYHSRDDYLAGDISTLSSMASSAPSRSYPYMQTFDGNMEPRRRIFDHPSRLVPLEERRHLQNLDPELRAIAMRGGFFGNIPVDLDAFLSEETIARRRVWFIFVAVLSIFPFFSLLAWMGKFDEGLSWYTEGEVHRLSQPQQRILTGILIAHCIILPALSVFLVVYFALPALRA